MELVAGLRDEVEFWLCLLHWVWAGDLPFGNGNPSQNRVEAAGLKWVGEEIKR